jgi:hypothetical protein
LYRFANAELRTIDIVTDAERYGAGLLTKLTIAGSKSVAFPSNAKRIPSVVRKSLVILSSGKSENTTEARSRFRTPGGVNLKAMGYLLDGNEIRGDDIHEDMDKPT